MKTVRFAAVCAALAVAAGSVAPSQLLAQAARPMLQYESAAAMRDGCVAFAKEHGIQVAIAVYDDELRLVSYDRMDGASHGAGELARWKGEAAASYRIATAEQAKWNVPHVPYIATFPGGVPVFTDEGVALGAIGVSGATGEQDAACAMAGIAAAGLEETAG